MRAITCSGYGSPDRVLAATDIDEPVVADDEVLVDVEAASVNPADWHLVRGVPYLARLQIGLRRPSFVVPGSDFAGRVVAVGRAVTTFTVGDDVFGTSFMHGFGAFAERVAVPEDLLAHKPGGIGFGEAAAVPLAGLTALQAVRDRGHIERGGRVLVIGASGGVGTFAVQLAKVFGAEVTGVCSAKNADLVRSLGAGQVIDYTSSGPWEDLGRYDLVVQAAGTRTASELRRLLEPGGTLVQISGESDNRWLGPVGRIAGGRLLSGLVSQTITTFTVGPNASDLTFLATLLDRGEVRPVVDTTYPLDRVADAIAHVERGHTRGKVVLHTGATARRDGRRRTATSTPGASGALDHTVDASIASRYAARSTVDGSVVSRKSSSRSRNAWGRSTWGK